MKWLREHRWRGKFHVLQELDRTLQIHLRKAEGRTALQYLLAVLGFIKKTRLNLVLTAG